MPLAQLGRETHGVHGETRSGRPVKFASARIHPWVKTMNLSRGRGFCLSWVSGRMTMMPSVIQAITGAEPAAVETAEPEIQTRTSPAQGDPANDWLCAWCFNRVASEKDRFTYEGKSEFSFRNPEGMLFYILTFSRALGCRRVGTPNLEHTWFPGHAWSACVCDRCGMHLGWHYTGPSEFVGLIRDRIVRASLVLN